MDKLPVQNQNLPSDSSPLSPGKTNPKNKSKLDKPLLLWVGLSVCGLIINGTINDLKKGILSIEELLVNLLLIFINLIVIIIAWLIVKLILKVIGRPQILLGKKALRNVFIIWSVLFLIFFLWGSSEIIKTNQKIKNIEDKPMPQFQKTENRITPSPTNVSPTDVSLTPEESNTVKAKLLVPEIDGKYSDKWTAYSNWDYNFSFLFPAKWRVDLSDDHMDIDRLECLGCAGGFAGVAINYYKTEGNQSLSQYISEFRLRPGLISGNIGLYKTKNPNITVFLDRLTPGAGPGQTAFIANNKDNAVVELYCGACSDLEMNNIISTFDFETETERDSNDSWTKYL